MIVRFCFMDDTSEHYEVPDPIPPTLVKHILRIKDLIINNETMGLPKNPPAPGDMPCITHHFVLRFEPDPENAYRRENHWLPVYVELPAHAMPRNP